MKNNLTLVIALLIMTMIGISSSSAQFTIKIPKIPKISKSKKEKPPSAEDKTGDNSDSIENAGVGNGRNSEFEDKWDKSVLGKHFLEEIEKHTEHVENYDRTKNRGLFYNDVYKYAEYAISQKARDKWFAESTEVFGDRKSPKNYLDPALDRLAAAIAKRLPNFVPHKNNFAVRNSTYEKMMTARLKNFSALKIYNIGLFHNNWIIVKNNYDIPRERYKQGFIWAKDSSDDHPYCHLYAIDIKQEYSGGGTFGSSYAGYADDRLFGCPVEK